MIWQKLKGEHFRPGEHTEEINWIYVVDDRESLILSLTIL